MKRNTIIILAVSGIVLFVIGFIFMSMGNRLGTTISIVLGVILLMISIIAFACAYENTFYKNIGSGIGKIQRAAREAKK